MELIACSAEQSQKAFSPHGVSLESNFNRIESYSISKFLVVLFSMICSTIPISIIGNKFAMSIEPFWIPDQYSKAIIVLLL